MAETERCERYEIVEAGQETTPAENPKRSFQALWGRRWRLRDEEGGLHAITFEADLAFLGELERGAVSDDVRRIFEAAGRTALEDDYCHRAPAELPRWVVLKSTAVEEQAG